MNKSAVLPANILDLLELPQDNQNQPKKTNRHSQNIDEMMGEFLLCEENKDESVHSKELETALYLDQYIAFLKQLSLQIQKWNKSLFFDPSSDEL